MSSRYNSERKPEAELHVTLRSSAQDRVEPEAYIRSSEEGPEPAANPRRVTIPAADVASVGSKHSMIQYVEHTPTKLHGIALLNFEVFEYAHVELGNAWLAEHVPSGVAYGSACRI